MFPPRNPSFWLQFRIYHESSCYIAALRLKRELFFFLFMTQLGRMIVSDQSCKETKSPFWAQRVKILRALRKVKFVKHTDTKEKTSSTNSPYAAFKDLSLFLFIHLQSNYDLDILTRRRIWMTILVLYRKPTLLLQQVHHLPMAPTTNTPTGKRSDSLCLPKTNL